MCERGSPECWRTGIFTRWSQYNRHDTNRLGGIFGNNIDRSLSFTRRCTDHSDAWTGCDRVPGRRVAIIDQTDRWRKDVSTHISSAYRVLHIYIDTQLERALTRGWVDCDHHRWYTTVLVAPNKFRSEHHLSTSIIFIIRMGILHHPIFRRTSALPRSVRK